MSSTMIEGLTAIGASTLRHFRHPEDWQDGTLTGNPRLVDTMVLKVDQLRFEGTPIAVKGRNQVVILAIRAWAASVGVKPFELRFDVTTDAAYLYVPHDFFVTRILPKLETLA